MKTSRGCGIVTVTSPGISDIFAGMLIICLIQFCIKFWSRVYWTRLVRNSETESDRRERVFFSTSSSKSWNDVVNNIVLVKWSCHNICVIVQCLKTKSRKHHKELAFLNFDHKTCSNFAGGLIYLFGLSKIARIAKSMPQHFISVTLKNFENGKLSIIWTYTNSKSHLC